MCNQDKLSAKHCANWRLPIITCFFLLFAHFLSSLFLISYPKHFSLLTEKVTVRVELQLFLTWVPVFSFSSLLNPCESMELRTGTSLNASLHEFLMAAKTLASVLKANI